MAKKRSALELKIPYGLRADGRMVAPVDTPRGQNCGCICAECNTPLVSNQGAVRQPYFSHRRTSECSGGLETSLHVMAKQIIQDSKQLTLPAFEHQITAEVSKGQVLTEELSWRPQDVMFERVEVEKSFAGLRPDLIGTLPDGTPILIEIYVTHRVSEDKREQLANHSIMEIDLSAFERTAYEDKATFIKAVLATAPRHWHACQLHNDEILEKQERLKARADLIAAEQERKAQRRESFQKRNVQAMANLSVQRDKAHSERDKVRAKFAPQLQQLAALNHERHYLEPFHAIPHRALKVAEGLTGRDPHVLITLGSCKPSILNEHPLVWRSFIYVQFIKNKTNRLIKADDITQAVIEEFGVYEWAETLNSAYATRKHLTPAETATLASPFNVVQAFLEYLAAHNLLDPSDPIHHRFWVKVGSFEALDAIWLNTRFGVRNY